MIASCLTAGQRKCRRATLVRRTRNLCGRMVCGDHNHESKGKTPRPITRLSEELRFAPPRHRKARGHRSSVIVFHEECEWSSAIRVHQRFVGDAWRCRRVTCGRGNTLSALRVPDCRQSPQVSNDGAREPHRGAISFDRAKLTACARVAPQRHAHRSTSDFRNQRTAETFSESKADHRSRMAGHACCQIRRITGSDTRRHTGKRRECFERNAPPLRTTGFPG